MGLTTGHGPLSPEPAGRFSPPLAPGTAFVEPHPRRVQAVRDGRVVLDTERALLVHRPGRTLTFAFPADDVVGLPSAPEPAAPGHVAVPWDAVDRWVEEGRVLVHYPPNPYHRVDCRPTTRRLRVEVAGTTLVDTDDTVVLFETALAPVLYVDRGHVRTDLLHPSPTTTYCNYKGWATYWSVAVGDVVVADAAWAYEGPPPESLPVRGLLAFDPARVTVTAELPGGPPPPPAGRPGGTG